MGTQPEHQPREHRPIDDERRAELVAGYKQSGLSQREYAQRTGIDYNTLGALLWKQQRPAAQQTGPLPARIEAPAELEVTLPNKTVVRGRNAPEVLRLIEALKNLEKQERAV